MDSVKFLELLLDHCVVTTEQTEMIASEPKNLGVNE